MNYRPVLCGPNHLVLTMSEVPGQHIAKSCIAIIAKAKREWWIMLKKYSKKSIGLRALKSPRNVAVLHSKIWISLYFYGAWHLSCLWFCSKTIHCAAIFNLFFDFYPLKAEFLLNFGLLWTIFSLYLAILNQLCCFYTVYFEKEFWRVYWIL